MQPPRLAFATQPGLCGGDIYMEIVLRAGKQVQNPQFSSCFAGVFLDRENSGKTGAKRPTCFATLKTLEGHEVLPETPRTPWRSCGLARS